MVSVDGVVWSICSLFYFYIPNCSMRVKTASPLQRYHEDQMRAKPKREFLVEEHRKEFDDYMLTQVKKNKKSVKHIKKTIDLLKAQMDHLNQQNKRHRNDYERLSQQMKTLQRQTSQCRVAFTSHRSPRVMPPSSSLHKTRKQFIASKESSFSGKSSGIDAYRGKSSSQSVHRGKGETSSKTVLKKKIEDLKEKAHIIKQNAQEIQEEINKKISQKLIQHSSRHAIPHPQDQQQHQNNKTKDYQELMELLKTNKRIQESSQPPAEVSLNMGEVPPAVFSDKSMLSTNRDPTPLKNSIAASYYYAERPPTSPITSETNLLDSEKHLQINSDKQLLPKSPRQMKVSRCVNVQVAGEEAQSQLDGLLKECRGSGSELSFEGLNSQQQLKELQFQFDHLVRQELLSNDPKEKETLGKSIRALLERISLLRQQFQHSR